jgi:ERCC4-type nuclease
VIPIEVDHRESAAAVLPALRNCPDFSVAITHLPLGDYLVDGRFLFERKTMSDLAVSIIAGRFFEQALRLAKASTRAALILEGTSRELAESGMSWESIQGALVTATLFCGIPILRARSVEQTVSTMLRGASGPRSGDRHTAARRLSPSRQTGSTALHPPRSAWCRGAPRAPIDRPFRQRRTCFQCKPG